MEKCTVKQIRFHLSDENERKVNEFLERKPHCISQLCTIALTEMIKKYNLENASDKTIKDFLKIYPFLQSGDFSSGLSLEVLRNITGITTEKAKATPFANSSGLADTSREGSPVPNTFKIDTGLISDEERSQMNSILQDFMS